MKWLALLLALASVALGGQGYRNDGTGRWPGTLPPLTWSPTEHVLWATKLPSWSNASPIVVGGRVCAASEPTTLLCVDADTGRLLWQAPHAVVDAVDADRRAEIAAEVAKRAELTRRLAEARSTYATGLRALRTTGGTDDGTLAALQAETDRIATALDAIPSYETPPDQGMVGWSSPTPVTDGTAIYALFANGVVAAHELDGRLRWAVWLGRRPHRMLGWDEGHAASPVIAGGVLVVPFGQLTGLDPRTGAVLWQQGPWPHFGSPAVTTVSGTALVLTPDGRAVRARDGRVLATGLADIWYLQPVVDEDRAFFLEARSDVGAREQGGVTMRAWRLLGVEGDALKAEPMWTTKLPIVAPFYGSPLVLDHRLHLVTHRGALVTVDQGTGAVLSTVQATLSRIPEVFASLAAAAGRIYVTDENGVTAVLVAGATPRQLATNTLWPMRSSPALVANRLYVRTRDHLVAIAE